MGNQHPLFRKCMSDPCNLLTSVRSAQSSPSPAKGTRGERPPQASPPLNPGDILGKRWSDTEFPRNNPRSVSNPPLLPPFDLSQPATIRPSEISSEKDKGHVDEEQDDEEQEDEEQEERPYDGEADQNDME